MKTRFARAPRVVLAALAGLLAAGCLAGCAGKVDLDQVTSPWPKASMERTVTGIDLPVRWPFTGRAALKENDVKRRPLSIKIENSPASRPQTGLSSADVVYETISEGGITRFNCIFHSSVPEIIGPVRSARLSDLYVVPQYDGLFFFSGAHPSVRSEVRAAGLPDLSQDAGVGKPYFRSSARHAPHNLYLEARKTWDIAKSRGMRVTSKAKPLRFEQRSVTETTPVTSIDVPFSQANRVRWEFKKDRWYRLNNGVAHNDAATGKQITADNVVVIWADYQVARRDKVGSTTFRIVLGGKGKAAVFKHGQRLDGTWSATRSAPPKFADKDGKPILLAPGRTWFQVIPKNGTISTK